MKDFGSFLSEIRFPLNSTIFRRLSNVRKREISRDSKLLVRNWRILTFSEAKSDPPLISRYFQRLSKVQKRRDFKGGKLFMANSKLSASKMKVFRRFLRLKKTHPWVALNSVPNLTVIFHAQKFAAKTWCRKNVLQNHWFSKFVCPKTCEFRDALQIISLKNLLQH